MYKSSIEILKYWEFSRDKYNQWLSETKLRNIFAKTFVFESFSIWWAMNLTQKR